MGNRTYYNEIDPYAAEWLRNLIKAGHIPDGDVDERSIADVQPMDIADYTQCHFFAGIAGWSHALRLAGWPDDQAIWTGSCPCQPFSVAGRRAGANDERHLWPEFARLIRACQPEIVMGEQVAGAAGYEWFDAVAHDLEDEGYACEAVDIPACSIGAWHIRNRLYWCASNTMRERIPRHIKTGGVSEMRPRWSGSAMDLRAVLESPYDAGTGFPQPLIRSVDDGFSTRVGRLRAYGNAIVPPLAAEVIKAFMDA